MNTSGIQSSPSSSEAQSPPPSREGSVTPTPEDLDEPQTPKEDKSCYLRVLYLFICTCLEYARPTLTELVQHLSSVVDREAIAKHLNISLDEAGSIEGVYELWLERNPLGSWNDIIYMLNAIDHSTLAAELESKYNFNHGKRLCLEILISHSK